MVVNDDLAGRRLPSASPSLDTLMAENRQARSGAASTAALAFAFGAVAFWATNALVGKTLLAKHRMCSSCSSVAPRWFLH